MSVRRVFREKLTVYANDNFPSRADGQAKPYFGRKVSSAPAKQIHFRLRKSHLTEWLLLWNVRMLGVFQGGEKMKPIFSTEQARDQKFASFFY